MKTTSQSQVSAATMLLIAACWLLAAAGGAQASQGCPFDDGSCQEYCSQQGCNMGYCGHFAWIQCICRKCGDEWSWYDKVRYNPDKTVNQTELDSLKLNATSPLILTNSSAGQQQQNVSSSTRPQQQPQQQQQVQADAAAQSRDGQAASGLTTLLIPDLSDGSKLDLNDIPDENSEKFLDYLAKNHERLVQATSSRQQQDSKSKSQQQQQQQPDEQLTAEESESTSLAADDEAVEIQISSNNNNNSISTPAASQQTTTTPTTTSSASSAASVESPSTTTEQPQQQQQQRSPLIRLLHMAADEQLFNAGEQ